MVLAKRGTTLGQILRCLSIPREARRDLVESGAALWVVIDIRLLLQWRQHQHSGAGSRTEYRAFKGQKVTRPPGEAIVEAPALLHFLSEAGIGGIIDIETGHAIETHDSIHWF